MKLLAVALCWLGCHAYAPGGRTPRRLVAVRAESEDRAEQIKKLNDMFYGSTSATDAPRGRRQRGSTPAVADLPLWRVQWNALPGERQVYNVHVPHYTALFEKLVRRPCINQMSQLSTPSTRRQRDDLVSTAALCTDSLVDLRTGTGPEALVFWPYTITGRIGQFKDPEVRPT